MLTTGVELISEDLYRWGEEEAAFWVLTCSDEELVRICTVADWLLHFGPGRASGESMMIAKACALAAVYVREGRPRDLARIRRRPALARRSGDGGRRPDHVLHAAVPPEYGVGGDAREYWRIA